MEALLGATTIGLLLFLYQHLDNLAGGHEASWLVPLVNELTSVYGLLLLLPLLVRGARRFRLNGKGWPSGLTAHLGFAVATSVVLTSWRWGTRSLLYPVLGLGPFDYGVLRVRYLMELPMDALVYGVAIGFTYLYDEFQASKRREVRVARLETELLKAQLDALRARLDPHFLFNALNTVSSVMYDDPARADAVLARLSDLLRRTLRAPLSQATTVADEFEVVNLYLDVMRARFGTGIDAVLTATDDALPAILPPLVLQPLVENAVRHGAPAGGGVTRIHVGARLEGTADESSLVLEVRDSGPGIMGDWRARDRGGIGLSHTAARLERIYGARHLMELRNADEGGMLARIVLPYEVAVADDPTTEPVCGD